MTAPDIGLLFPVRKQPPEGARGKLQAIRTYTFATSPAGKDKTSMTYVTV